MSGPFAGAEMRTRGAPALRCPSAFSRSVKRPVHSRTRSALFAAWGRSAGDFVAVTWISFPLTTIPFSVAFTSAARTPWTESYLRRWARVFVSVRSLIETNSRSFSPRSIAARTMHRPIRPKPLIAIRAIVFPPRVRVRVRGRKEAPKLPSDPGGVNGNAGAASRQKHGGADRSAPPWSLRARSFVKLDGRPRLRSLRGLVRCGSERSEEHTSELQSHHDLVC